MSKTLTEIIEAIEAGTIGELDLTVEEEVLAGSFVHERLERPEMLRVVVEHEGLLQRYLGLPAEQRALLERLRSKRPEYLQGDYEAEAPFHPGRKPRELTQHTFDLYNDTHSTKAITQITQHYINHKPQSNKGPVPLTNWFLCYNPNTNTNLKPKIKGKRQHNGTAPGNKYYDQWHTLKQKQAQTTPDFETWILNQTPTELRERLRQTPYFLVKNPSP